MNCKLEFLYYLTRTADSSVSTHRHGCYELVYYKSGYGITNIAGTDYSYKQGTFAVIQPDTYHDERREIKTDVLFIGFHFCNRSIELKNGLYKDTNFNSILCILQKLKDEMLERKALYEMKFEALLQELAVEIIRIVTEKSDVKKDFSHIESFLLENHVQDIDFNTLAELSGYSYHRFRHIFKGIYGVSPYQYVINLRLKSAGEMLIKYDYTILRTAQENGFASQSQFCRLFRRMYGFSPGEYRKRHRLSSDKLK